MRSISPAAPVDMRKRGNAASKALISPPNSIAHPYSLYYCRII
jgi:hypothetical protein